MFKPSFPQNFLNEDHGAPCKLKKDRLTKLGVKMK